MRIINADVFDVEKGFVEKTITMRGAHFAAEEQEAADSAEPVWDATGCYAIPGLIDLHTHGCMRHDFSTASPEGIRRMRDYQAQNGITALCATTMTLPQERLEEACARLKDSTGGAELLGIHLEGPFLSPDKLGAQNPLYVQKPDVALYRRLQAISGGLVKLLALAPEMDGGMELIRAVSGEVVCSLAHTTASYAVATEAFANGTRQVTHLYNAMPPFAHREPGVVGAALDAPDCRVELICDGIHVHPSMVRATFRLFGDDRIVFISDSMEATGLADGSYELGELSVLVQDGAARLQGSGALAGSVSNLMNCLRTAVLQMGIPLAAAVKCAAVNPAKVLGVFDERGSIAPGKIADLVLLNPDLSLAAVFLKGQLLEMNAL